VLNRNKANRRTAKVRASWVAIITIAIITACSIAAQDTDKAKRLAEGEREAKNLLLLMDKDKSGKVSRQEFMSFMEAEFERLDVNHDGELDVEELTHSRVQVRSRGR
jgi:hypothetical protein